MPWFSHALGIGRCFIKRIITQPSANGISDRVCVNVRRVESFVVVIYIRPNVMLMFPSKIIFVKNAKVGLCLNAVLTHKHVNVNIVYFNRTI